MVLFKVKLECDLGEIENEYYFIFSVFVLETWNNEYE